MLEVGVAEGSDPAAAGPGRAWMLSELALSDPMLMFPLSDASSAQKFRWMRLCYWKEVAMQKARGKGSRKQSSFEGSSKDR